jgi:hypothetical protein
MSLATKLICSPFMSEGHVCVSPDGRCAESTDCRDTFHLHIDATNCLAGSGLPAHENSGLESWSSRLSPALPLPRRTVPCLAGPRPACRISPSTPPGNDRISAASLPIRARSRW